jgi:aspartate carbamoyltransferase catalytic subunit
MAVVPHLMTLADLSGPQIYRAINHAYHLKQLSTPWLAPQLGSGKQPRLRMPSQSLFNKSVALLFSKRSTRTRLAAETAALLLGGRALFLGKEDIQLGVNESPRDTARVIGGMCQGIFARVGDHSEIEVREMSRTLNSRLISPDTHHFAPRNSQSTRPYQSLMHCLPFGIPHKFSQTFSHFTSMHTSLSLPPFPLDPQ